MATALIQERNTVSGNQPRMQRLNEKAGQTWKSGTPVMIDTTVGALKAWDGTTITNGIAGIAKEFGANLATTGVAQQQTFGSVQNESAAANYSRPYFNDGQSGIIVANQDTVFYGQVGPAQTTAVTDVGKQYGMTIDSDGHWYVDKTKTGVNAVLEIVGLDDWDTARGVKFVFLSTTSQIVA
jgi:hypothetical protein